MLRLIMRVASVALIVMCLAVLDHAREHGGPERAPAASTSLAAPVSAAQAGALPTDHGQHGCAVLSTSAQQAWTAPPLMLAGLATPYRNPAVAARTRWQRASREPSLLLDTGVCRT